MIKDLKLINIDLMTNFFDKTKNQAKSLLNYYEKKGILIKIKRGYYLNKKKEVSKEEISNFIFPKSYISVGSILFEEGLIKQYSYKVQSISSITKTQKISFGLYLFENFKININTQLGFIIGKDNIGKATKERALLDLLYLKFYSSNFSFDNEIYLSKLDTNLLEELLFFYGIRIQKYYLKNIKGQQILFLN